MTDKKLYKVTVEVDLVVLAHNEQEAIEVARTHADDEAGNYSFDTLEVTRRSQLPEGWTYDCLPYSFDEEQLYIGQYIDDV